MLGWVILRIWIDAGVSLLGWSMASRNDGFFEALGLLRKIIIIIQRM